MEKLDLDEKVALRALIHGFIQERKQAKLDKLKPDDVEGRSKIEEDYRPEAWLADAARRAGKIQLATHIVKATHGKIKGASDVYEAHVSDGVTVTGYVGSYELGESRTDDGVCNAADLPVLAFLNLSASGRTLAQRAVSRDPAFCVALSDDPETAADWCVRFAAIADTKVAPASHTLAKQVYFPLPDGSYHLLAPLFPSSLVHRAQRTMREDRFGEAAKAARQARTQGAAHARGFCEYPGLAIRKLGGTKPLNISKLNHERFGENWLLASLPPSWKSEEVRPAWGVESVFNTLFGRQRAVRSLIKELRTFLQNVEYNNVHVRWRRARLVGQLCDEANQFAERLRQLPAGWSADKQCELVPCEQFWLDPLRARADEEFALARRKEDWPAETSRRFGNWLNAELSTSELPFGDAEHAAWSSELLAELKLFHEILEDARD